MPLQNWSDPAADEAARQRARQSWDRILAARQTATLAQAQAVSTMAANYPHMRPGTVMPLAQAGVAPSDPLAQDLALREAKNNKKKRGFLGAVGDIVGGITSIPAGIGQFVVGDVLNPVGGAALSALKPVTRVGLTGLAAPFEAGAGALRNVAAATGNIGAGFVSGAAAGAGIGGFFGGVGAIPGALVGAGVGAVAGIGAGAVAEARGVEIESEGFVNPLAQTTLFQSLGSAGLGEGYMPGGTAAVKAAEASRRAAAIGGHALTPGRFLASSIVEEGTAPYNLLSGALDASVAWRLDPTALAGKGLSRWQKVSKEFVSAGDVAKLARQDAGLVDSARKTILTEKVDSWLGSKAGQKSMAWFADADFDAIRTQLGNKVDIGVVDELARATTPDEVNAIFRPRLGLDRGLELKPKVGAYGMEVKRTLQSRSRLFNELPTGRLDYADPTEATHQFNLILRDANVPADEAAKFTEEFAGNLLRNDFAGRRAADALVYRSLIGSGDSRIAKVAPELARSIAKRAADGDEKVLRALIDGDVTKTAVNHVSLGGETRGLVSGGYLADHIDQGIDFDRKTLRDIRNVTSKYQRLLAPDTRIGKKFQTSTSAMEHFTNDIWKPTALLRGAWTVRVVGEEQIRMAASGKLSVFNHPISYLAWALDDEGQIANIFKRFGMDVGGRGTTSVTGEKFDQGADALEAALHGRVDEYQAARGVKQQAEGWHDGTFVKARHEATLNRGQEGFHDVLAEQIDKMHSDPLMRRMASEPDHQVRQWFVDGEGAQLRQEMADSYGAQLRSRADADRHMENARRTLNKTIGRSEGKPAQFTATGGVAAPSTLTQAGNRQLLDTIATGKLNGVPIRTANGNVNKDFLAELQKLDIETLPDSLTGMAKVQPDSRYAAWRDKTVETLYTNLMGRPSAKLSRSPHFRQHYWEEAEDIITELSPDAASALVANARKAKLDNATIRRLEDRQKLARGEVTLNEADLLARGRALDATVGLLYDSSKKGQLADTLRIIMPFASAQKEVMSTWAKLGTQNPQTIRRAQQFISAARGSGSFYKDPTTGEEMFTFPMSEWLTEQTLGIPIPLTGRVQGLNMFGSGIMPGVGPAVQIPARWMLPDKPQFDDLNKFLDPFGTSATEQQGIIEQQLPGWFTKVRTAWSAPESDRVFANTIKDVWAQGLSAGRYSADTPESIQDGLDHAKSTARWLYFIRGLSSVAGAPTPPSPKFMAMDKDGKWHMAKALSEDYRKMIDDPNIGFEKATAAFIDKYGSNAAAFMQSKTYSTTPSAPSTTDFSAWARGGEAKGLEKKYGEVYSLFGPQGEGFDYQAYLRNIKSGATETLDPEQFVEQTNNRQAQMIYHNYKDRFGPAPSKEQRAWLSDLRSALRTKFPGYDTPLPGKPDQETVKQQYIPAIQRAVSDDALKNNDVAKAARTYLAARSQAEKIAEEAGFTFQQAKDAAPLREWLRQIGGKLSERTPDFGVMFERVFEREMLSDDMAEAGVSVA